MNVFYLKNISNFDDLQSKYNIKFGDIIYNQDTLDSYIVLYDDILKTNIIPLEVSSKISNNSVEYYRNSDFTSIELCRDDEFIRLNVNIYERMLAEEYLYNYKDNTLTITCDDYISIIDL